MKKARHTVMCIVITIFIGILAGCSNETKTGSLDNSCVATDSHTQVFEIPETLEPTVESAITSTVASTKSSVTTPTVAPTKAPTTSNERAYVLNTSSKKFHYPSCKRLPTKNRSDITSTRDKLISQGYEPCGVCNP